MSYQVLARKYRPTSFEEIAGQSHILKILTHALQHQRLHHAYLFTGTRGVGKTSLARILAKCFNCESGVTATPCNTCTHCIQINEGRHLDVIEADAASKTKVEDTRTLLDNIPYLPNTARFKIYIIDEVHMLSTHSFNALLKTLEEPPAHIKFILATTDPQKLPVTILSRCLHLHLQHLSTEIISRQLDTVLQKENFKKEIIDREALDLIAKAAEGSMRDALSLLDQAINYTHGKLNKTDVSQMLGYIDTAQIIELFQAVSLKDTKTLLSLIDTLETNGTDFFTVLNEMLLFLQQQSLSQMMHQNASTTLSLSPEDLQLYYQIILIGKRDLPLAPEPKSGFIMMMLRLMAFTPEHKHSNAGISDWSQLVEKLNLTGMTKLLSENAILNQDVTPSQINLHLTIDPNYAAFLTPETKENLTQALKKYFSKTSCEITFSIAKSSDELAAQNVTPSRKKTELKEEAQKTAETALLSDKNVQAFIQTFSAELQATTPITIPKAFQDSTRRERSRGAECINEYTSTETSSQQSRILKGEG